MSTVVLTPQVREIPYFSDFPLNEERVVVPRPFINESIDYRVYGKLEDVKTEDILTILENRIYLGFEKGDNEELVKELLWRFGETKEKMDIIDQLSSIVQNELKPYLEKERSEYIYGIRCKVIINKRSCPLAAKYGNLRLLKWLREIGCSWDSWTCSNAVSNGHLEVVKYLRENECTFEGDLCSFSAEGGHLETLKYLISIGYNYTQNVCKYAALNGRLDVLKWARENNCPWNESTCSFAAAGGQLETLKWLRENECPWSEMTCLTAAENNKLETLKWAYENGCPCPKSNILLQVSRSNTDIINWLSTIKN